MRIHLKVSLIISLLFINSIAQNAPDTLWTKIFDGGEYWGGDFGYCVQQTLDGGYIVCGSRADSTTIYPGIWILKTDQTGDTLWSRTFPGHHGRGRDCLQQTVDGGFALVGTHLGRIFLIKTDTNGDTLWTKFYDIEEISGTGSVYQTHDGGYIITGSTPETDNYFSDVVLIRTNSSGDTIWTKTYDRHYGDLGYSVQQTLDGGYIIAAETGWWGDFWSDIWLLKTDINGDTLWTKVFSRGEGHFVCKSVRQTKDLGYILVGSTQDAGGQIALIKTDAYGDTLWTKILIIGYVNWDNGNDVCQTEDGGYIITGVTWALNKQYCDLYVLKTDSVGNILWTNILDIPHEQYGNGIKQTTDRGYIVAGVATFNEVHRYNIWLLKFAAENTAAIAENHQGRINSYALLQNYPNPFNPVTMINYQLPARSAGGSMFSDVDLSIYNVLGQRVTTLVSEKQTAGHYQVRWDASDFPSGVYWYRLQAGGFEDVKKMILLR